MRHETRTPFDLDRALDRAAALVTGRCHAAPGPGADRSEPDGGDGVDPIAEFACLTARQFAIVVRLARSQRCALTLIPVIVDRATGYGGASADAVGAAAALTGAACTGDAGAALGHIDAARSELGDATLADGMVAFAASLAVQIAAMTELDPIVVLDQLRPATAPSTRDQREARPSSRPAVAITPGRITPGRITPGWGGTPSATARLAPLRPSRTAVR